MLSKHLRFFWSRRILVLFTAVCLLAGAILLFPRFGADSLAAEGTLVIDPTQAEGEGNNGIHDVSDLLYGIFFEDINHGADGGMSAEMVVNQSFEYKKIDYDNKSNGIVPDNQRWWNIDSGAQQNATKALMTTGGMSQSNPTYLRITSKIRGYRLFNAGFQGDDFNRAGNPGHNAPNLDDYAMNIKDGGVYEFSVYIKQDASSPYSGSLDAYLQDKQDNVISTTGSITVNLDTPTTWTKYSVRIQGTSTSLGALFLDFQGKGVICIDFVSLMPIDAYGFDDSRYTGGKIKKEIVDIFAAMNPRFLRFPGGCVAEGDVNWSNVYNWKHTVGKLEDRVGTPNTWEYWQSYNIGFYEYFLLCEDLGMKAMPVVSAGLICQARMGETGALIYKYNHPDFRAEVVDAALHLIYFCKGSVESADPVEREWAQLRTQSGHPEPFELDMISLGNENWGDVYWDNFAAAVAALRSYNYGYYQSNPTDMLAKWGIQIVTTSGTDVWGSAYGRAWAEVNGVSASNATEAGKYKDMIVDEHYYNTASWYISNRNRYDSYDRNGAKVFVGEYSANGGGGGTVNTLEAALAEAAFMCGLERNSDIVEMASYAPFFGRQGNSNWATNAIWLNAKNIMLTPNYHVQQMFGANVGDRFIPTTISGSLSGVYQSVTEDTVNDRVIVKVVNTSNTTHTLNIDLSAFAGLRSYYNGVTMQHNNASIRNQLADEYAGAVINNVSPVDIPKTEFSGNTATYQLKNYSVSVLIFHYGTERSDADLESMRVVGGEVEAFDATKTSYNVVLPAGSAVPHIIAVPSDKSAKVAIAYASDMSGTTTVTVTADSGAQKVYSLTYSTPPVDPDNNNGGGDNGGGGCGAVSLGGSGLPYLFVCAFVVCFASLRLGKRARTN